MTPSAPRSRRRLSAAWRRMWLIGLTHLVILAAVLAALTTVAVRVAHDRLFAIIFIAVGVCLAVALGRAAYAVREGRPGATLTLGWNCAAVVGVVAASFFRSRPPIALTLLAIAAVEVVLAWRARKSPPFAD